MAEATHSRKRGSVLAIWAIAVAAAAIVFWGTLRLLNALHPVNTSPAAAAITHSTPVGGVLRDGVFHPTPPDGAVSPIRWRI